MSDSGGANMESAMLAEAREDLAKADQKATLVLATLGIGFGAVLGGVLAGGWNPTQLFGAGEVLWWIGTGLFAIAVVLAGTAVWPRYDAGDASAGIYYWAHVASFESLASLSAALDSTDPDMAYRTRNQLWSISRIVEIKYRSVRASMMTSLAAASCIACGLVVSNLVRP